MGTFRLYKKEKLCSNTAINLLFVQNGDAQSMLAYPIRAVWRNNDARHCDAPMQFLINAPKKRLRHAVDRVAMRRRIREAYRLNHHNYPLPLNAKIDVAFIYVANNLLPYKSVEKAMRKLLKNISDNAPQLISNEETV